MQTSRMRLLLHNSSRFLGVATLVVVAACGSDAGVSEMPEDLVTLDVRDGGETSGAADVALDIDAPDVDTPDSDTAGRPDVTQADARDADAAVPDAVPDDVADVDASDTAADAADTAGSDADSGDATEADATDADAPDADAPDADAHAPDAEDAADSHDVNIDAEDGVDPGVPVPPEGVCALLENAGAEAGTLAPWTVLEGEFETVEGNGWTQRPDAYAGNRSFAAGSVASSEMVQRVDVSAWSLDRGAEPLSATLTAFVRTWSGDDEPRLGLRAYDAEGEQIAASTVGPWSDEEWSERTVTIVLPPQAVTLEASLRGDRRVGSDNDAYFDALDLCLGGQVAGPELTAPPYLMWVTEDAVSVRWETADAVVGELELDTPDGVERWSEAAPSRVHELRVDGLESGTTYGYRLAWPGGVSETWSFRTAPPADADLPFSFVVWGDNQNGPENFAAMTPTMADANPDFAFSTGDCVQNGTRDEFRSQLFAPLAPLSRHVPFLVAAGNHERYSDEGATLFDEYMSQPEDEHCFGWRYGGLYMVFIDTELSLLPGSAQHACITDALTSDDAITATFRGAAFHKPPRIEFWFGGLLAFPDSMEAPWVRETLEPLLEELDVDVVFNGHNHLYAYTPETPGGITWFTTGGAGGMIDTDFGLWRVATWPEIAVQVHDFHFLLVDVDGPTMTVRALSPSGSEIHSATVEADE